ncbi:Transcription factor asqA [Fusarium oxysporum f. sp. cubense]|uniref:Transcription factor asqA n=1 Tax=Fusarium oxysporum f. sp. cubense TaxID=61366 RepID=A0A559L589_FUSOC|nr:Transcription factor asqA [Fusarium oxysporum f. sp. cubense]
MSEPDPRASEAHQTLGFIRRKRKQVGRACDGCRLQRIKCDNSVPCLNCRTRGRECSNNNAPTVTTLPQAQDEIDKLRRRVKELEAQLLQARNSETPTSQQQEPTPPGGSPALTRPATLESSKTKFWDGVYLRPARSPHSAWFGPSSLYFFIHRLSTFLSAQADHMLIHLASNLEQLGQPTVTQDSSRLLAPLTRVNEEGFYLTPVQEGYFINLYWETYHTCIYAVVDEASFKAHYQSLYVDVPAGSPRKPSALVDIILAMCMQYHTSALPCGQQGNILEDNDATMAGRWYYRRAQTLLACEVESPSISTLQCHLLCALYVCGGSFHNMADTTISLAIRTAYMLGLHLDPPPTMPRHEREFRRRLWWSVFEADSKVGMKVGRPFLIRDSYVMPDLPSDTLEVAIESGSAFPPIGDNATWLSLNLQRTKLYQTARALNQAFYGHELRVAEGHSVYDDPNTMEDLANTWSPKTIALTEWTKQIPRALKTSRKYGSPYSLDDSILGIEQFAPQWLQRQRLHLELEYHHLCIGLHRPFLSFAPHQGSSATAMAVKCAQHAIQLTNINHQVLSKTPILNGWHEAFQWQWSAAMTLVGFAVAYLNHPLAPAVRSSIKLAVSVLDIFARSFDAASKAAVIVRTLHTNIESVMAQFEMQSGPTTVATMDGSVLYNPPAQGGMANAVANQFDSIGGDFDLLDMAMNVDFWADLDMLLPGISGTTTDTAAT